MSEGYVCIRGKAQAEIERKKSRFIGIATPVLTQEKAEAFIEEIRIQYPDATHHCFAYRAGLDVATIRFSDDREPAGTAGRPILEVIERNELDNVCVVVVRYYGGTQLGAGGLTRAYRAAATAVIEQAGVTRFVHHTLFEGDAPYADWARVERLLTRLGTHDIKADFQEVVRFQASVPTADFEALREAVHDESAGTIHIVSKGTTYAPHREEAL